jgi:hypothetical protein
MIRRAPASNVIVNERFGPCPSPRHADAILDPVDLRRGPITQEDWLTLQTPGGLLQFHRTSSTVRPLIGRPLAPAQAGLLRRMWRQPLNGLDPSCARRANLLTIMQYFPAK